MEKLRITGSKYIALLTVVPKAVSPAPIQSLLCGGDADGDCDAAQLGRVSKAVSLHVCVADISPVHGVVAHRGARGVDKRPVGRSIVAPFKVHAAAGRAVSPVVKDLETRLSQRIRVPNTEPKITGLQRGVYSLTGSTQMDYSTLLHLQNAAFRDVTAGVSFIHMPVHIGRFGGENRGRQHRDHHRKAKKQRQAFPYHAFNLLLSAPLHSFFSEAWRII